MVAAWLLIIPFVALLGIAFGAVFLRLGATLFNKIVGGAKVEMPPAKPIREGAAMPTAPIKPASDSPYATPMTATMPIQPQMISGVPVPSYGKAMLIVFVGMLVNFLIGFLFSGVGMLGRELAFPFAMLSNLASFFAFSAVITMMLPTTYPRALGVNAISIALAMLVGGILFVGLFLFFGVASTVQVGP